MRIRNGFVSNSSSSSFIIAVKGSLKEELKKLIVKETAEGNLFHGFIFDAVRVLQENCQKFSKTEAPGDAGYDTLEEYFKEDTDGQVIKALLNEGFTVYTGTLGDDSGETAEAVLCNMDLNYKSENLIIMHQGGY